MERAVVQVCTAVDLQKISTSEIFHYPKGENLNARAIG
jgi:hypothetical protein